MVSFRHLCTFISWEKPRQLPQFIFLLSLKLHDSKLMLKLYYLRVRTSLLIACDTNVALDSGLSLGALNLKLTTPDWKKQSVKGRNLLIEISLTKGFRFVRKWAPNQWKVNKGKIVTRRSQCSTIASCYGIQDSLGFWIPFRGLWIPGAGFQSFSVERGFWIPFLSGISEYLSSILDSKALEFQIDSTSKIFSGFGFY